MDNEVTQVATEAAIEPTHTGDVVETSVPGLDKVKREAQRLRSERNKAREELEAIKGRLTEIESTKEKQMQEETQRMIEQLNAERDALKSELNRTKDMATLGGKVRDPEAALKLLEADHRAEDGSILVDKLLERYPFLATEQGVVGTPGGGGVSRTGDPLDLNKALASGDYKLIAEAMNALNKRR